MKRATSREFLAGFLAAWTAFAFASTVAADPLHDGTAIPDPRHISNGWKLPSESYADQPYMVKTDDGAWLCVMTTGKGREGASGQHVISMRSIDRGRTWEPPVPLEPANEPEASYAVLLKVPYGRIYAFPRPT
jgi:hypothetical protein